MYYRVAGSDSEGVFFGLALTIAGEGIGGTVFDAADPVHPVGDAAGIRDFRGWLPIAPPSGTRALVVTARRIHFGAFKLGDPVMCGIIACRTNGPAIDYLRIGLRRLEYRGYHSVGVAVQNHRR